MSLFNRVTLIVLQLIFPIKKILMLNNLILDAMTYQEKAEEFVDAMYNFDSVEYRHNGAYYVPADDDLPW